MTTLPLTVCVQTVEPRGEEYHVDIINLGVPYDGRIYTLVNHNAKVKEIRVRGYARDVTRSIRMQKMLNGILQEIDK